jgi:hypothetical protein
MWCSCCDDAWAAAVTHIILIIPDELHSACAKLGYILLQLAVAATDSRCHGLLLLLLQASVAMG